MSAARSLRPRSPSAAGLYALGPPPLGKSLDYSNVVLDRDGKLLRAYAMPDGRWRLPANAQDVDPRFLKLLFAYEDKRFRSHHGIDPMALARAGVQFVRNGRIVSGGSTLTMQVARLLGAAPASQRRWPSCGRRRARSSWNVC